MKKVVNIIYLVAMFCVVAIVLYLSTKVENEEKKDKESKTVLDNNETASNIINGEEPTYSDEELNTIDDAKKILAKGKQNQTIKGKYEDRPHSIVVDPKNITDEYVFFDPIRLINYEFISYEELNDLSQYETSIDPNDIKQCFEYGFTSAFLTYTKYRKVINEDGTLNSIVNVTKERLLDGVYGDIVKEDENHSYKPVKITVRISNNTQVSQEVRVFESWGISLQKFITMDDGNLYLYESLYNETLSNVGQPIYCSAKNRYGSDSYSVPEYIRIDGNESVEVSYIFMIDDSEEVTYIVMGIPEEMITSYYANFVRYFPISNLKKLEVDGR
jgi:hypothetical protein